ncbi:alpha-hydroxy acid dehydrogenase, FMN-dependent [Purpureocillium lavendulum]|uniref:Alpha-hydroxy acid dehydrogenase, FMN-dependent n=1 Tax=Purpureocillium lavendulum TaxID=1247861 RepID=A0AB34FGK7_9HYPO|nr:alpha-hydroxy acid dehydrogenase, FMN-dependent [Purpureocillium lavendulum]
MGQQLNVLPAKVFQRKVPAKSCLPTRNYTYYRAGSAGETSYQRNLDIYSQYPFRPRVLVDISKIESTLETTILGHKFAAPFYISPCARAGDGHADAEINFVKGAAEENILYMPALFASRTIEEIAAEKAEGQLYLSSNDTEIQELFTRTEKSGARAIVFTVDSAADGNRHRAARYGVGSADTEYSAFTWDFYRKLTTMTCLPIILKGIMSIEDAQEAVKNNVSAIILSNHGGRQLDGAPTALEVAIEIHQKDPELFKKIEVFADGGVRYGADVLKLLALGVKAVGLGRPFMYANYYGTEGVKQVIQQLKKEIALDAGNLGVADLQKINSNFVNWTPTCRTIGSP